MTRLIMNRRRFIGTTAMGAAALASPAYIRRANAQGSNRPCWAYRSNV